MQKVQRVVVGGFIDTPCGREGSKGSKGSKGSEGSEGSEGGYGRLRRRLKNIQPPCGREGSKGDRRRRSIIVMQLLLINPKVSSRTQPAADC